MAVEIDGGLNGMVTIAGGDLVRTDGSKFHIKSADDGSVQYWDEETGKTFVETIDELMERAHQFGRIKILPGEGKFENEIHNDWRDEYLRTFDS